MYNENMESEHKDKVDPEPSDAYSGRTSQRNVCFFPKDANAVFLNYGFLLAGEYSAELPAIILTFTTHVVTIKGYGLESTYFAFMEHIPRKVSVTDERYISITENDEFAITDIDIKQIEK